MALSKRAEMVARVITAVIDRETKSLSTDDYRAVCEEIRDDCDARLLGFSAERQERK